MTRPVAILGAGNLFAVDDAVGVLAVQALARRTDLPEGVRTLEIGVIGPDALAYISREEAVVILDAVNGGDAPGTLYAYDLATFEEATGPTPLSVHDLGVGELLRQARLLSRPIEGTLLGVEPARLEPPGAELSETVAQALPKLVEAALEEARRLAGSG